MTWLFVLIDIYFNICLGMYSSCDILHIFVLTLLQMYAFPLMYSTPDLYVYHNSIGLI